MAAASVWRRLEEAVRKNPLPPGISWIESQPGLVLFPRAEGSFTARYIGWLIHIDGTGPGAKLYAHRVDFGLLRAKDFDAEQGAGVPYFEEGLIPRAVAAFQKELEQGTAKPVEDLGELP